MRRVRYHRHGGPEVLQVEAADDPQPGPGQVQLRSEMIAASFVDTAMRSGTGPFGPGALPGSPHGEVVGTVERVGAGVDPGLVGRRLAVLVAADAFADVVVADAEWAAPVPDSVSVADATVLAMAGPVALLALEIARLQPGETVLIHGAAGSIGHLAVQLARVRGAGRILASVGSAAKVPFVRELGADAVVELADPGWPDRVAEAAPDGIDVVLDSLGGAVSSTSLGLLAQWGRLVVYGAAGGTLPEIPALPLLGMRTATGFGIREWRAARPDDARRHVAELTGHLATGRLRPTVTEVVPLDDAPRAHALLEDRSRVGRVLVRP